MASTILIVDDRVDNLVVLQSVLQQYVPNCQVLAAQSAAAGLTLAAGHLPDAIVSDVQMPEMDGLEMCRRLKADSATGHIPVLLLTSHSAATEVKVRGLEVGADDFVSKPVRVASLVAALQRVPTNAIVLER